MLWVGPDILVEDDIQKYASSSYIFAVGTLYRSGISSACSTCGLLVRAILLLAFALP